MEEDPAYLGTIFTKELLAKSLVYDQSVFEQYQQMTPKEQEKHQNFYDNITYVYQHILDVLEGETH